MKKLYIDVPAFISSGVDTGTVDCEYGYHRNNDGVASLMEVAEFAAYCRQCPEAFCVESCPKEALERQDSGVVKRYNMRCVGCKSCILACPFGTIFPEVINYLSSKCDFCLNQLNDNPEYIPACVKTAPAETFQMKDVMEEPEKYIFFVGEHLAVKSPSWRQKEGRE